jgi:hypothetical protein
MKAQVGGADGVPTDLTFTYLVPPVHRFEGSLSQHIEFFSRDET